MTQFFASIEFRDPNLLWLMLLAVPVVLLGWRTPAKVVFSSLALLPRGHTGWRVKTLWLPEVLLAAATAAFVLALAGPRVGEHYTQIQREGIAIMMVIDISGSMRALDLSRPDLEQTRLEAVQDVFEEFVLGSDELDGRANDAVGLVSFSGYADTAVPLTLDHENLVAIARNLEIITDRVEGGTAIGDALGLAVERLRESTTESKVAVLLTDGVNNAGVESPLAAAELARAQSVKVYTVGAGTNGMAPIRVENTLTGRSVLRSVPVEIDEETLKEIAERTGGKYFRATDRVGLTEVYAEIDRLERSRINEERTRQYEEYFTVPLLFAILAAMFGWFARNTFYRRVPE